MKSIYYFIALAATLAISSTGCTKETPEERESRIRTEAYRSNQYPGPKGKPGDVNQWGGEWRNFSSNHGSGGWYYKSLFHGLENVNAPTAFLVYIDTIIYARNPKGNFHVSMEDNSTAFDPFTGYKIKEVEILLHDTLLERHIVKELNMHKRVLVSIYQFHQGYREGSHIYFVVNW